VTEVNEDNQQHMPIKFVHLVEKCCNIAVEALQLIINDDVIFTFQTVKFLCFLCLQCRHYVFCLVHPVFCPFIFYPTPNIFLLF